MQLPTEIVDTHHLKLLKKIATGGMGTVYKAVQIGAEGFQKTMVVKTLTENSAHDPEFVEMFIGEAKLVADLIHENIVQIYQLGRFEESFYIAMEYIDGVNLQELQERQWEYAKRIPVELACFIISRVARALNYAHKKRDRKGKLLGVVHRDVSPKNILISFEGVVKLTDFGIAKAANLMRNREGDVLLGKLEYMSPEQISFQVTDRRSDFYSLGICFYELLTGEGLFGGEDTTVTMQRVMKETVPSIRQKLPLIPDRIEQIVAKCLKRSVRERYQDASQIVADMEHFMYDDGYGPTNLTLQKYVRELFPERIQSEAT